MSDSEQSKFGQKHFLNINVYCIHFRVLVFKFYYNVCIYYVVFCKSVYYMQYLNVLRVLRKKYLLYTLGDIFEQQIVQKRNSKQEKKEEACLCNLLVKSQIPPSYIHIEIIEQRLISYKPMIIRKLRWRRRLRISTLPVSKRSAAGETKGPVQRITTAAAARTYLLVFSFTA